MRRSATIMALLWLSSVSAFTRSSSLLSKRLVGSSLYSRTILDHTDDINDDDRDWQYVLHLAEDAARRAGEIMLHTTGRIAVSKEKANIRDIVTESDIACQQVIYQTINAVFPNDVFLGEEDVGSGSQASMEALQQALTSSSSSSTNDDQEQPLLWIVDPIDGTSNYQNGLPFFCASIGVVSWNQTTHEPEIKVGVVFNPILEEMTSAVAGRGAYLNGKRLNDTTSTSMIPLNESLVNVGFPVVKESTLQASAKAVAALATRVRGLRMIACASQVIAWVARNQMQAYVSWDLNAWDVCAGILIAREAGGSILDFASGEEATISSRDLIFTSPNANRVLAEDMRQVLEDNDCIEYDKDS